MREALWQRDDPSLDEVLAVAKRIEHSLRCVDIIKKENDIAKNSIHQITKKKHGEGSSKAFKYNHKFTPNPSTDSNTLSKGHTHAIHPKLVNQHRLCLVHFLKEDVLDVMGLTI